MSTATIFNVWVLINNPSNFYRELNMFMSMIYISSIWTVISYYKEFRKVEILTAAWQAIVNIYLFYLFLNPHHFVC